MPACARRAPGRRPRGGWRPPARPRPGRRPAAPASMIACRFEPLPEISTARRGVHAHLSLPLRRVRRITGRTRLAAATISPTSQASASSSGQRAAALLSRHHHQHAHAHVEDVGHLGVVDLARAAGSAGRSAARASCRAWSAQASPAGRCAAGLSISPPPVMCAMPLDVDAGRPQLLDVAQVGAVRRPAAHRPAGGPARAASAPQIPAGQHAPRQRIAVGVQPAGGQADARRRRRDRAAVDDAPRARPRRRWCRPGRTRPRAYTPGISAVSPPSSAQPASGRPPRSRRPRRRPSAGSSLREAT